MLLGVRSATVRQHRQPAVLLIGVAPAVVETLREVLAIVDCRVFAVAHVPAACERIPIAAPQLVVALSDARSQEEELVDRTTAVGAELLWVPAGSDDEALVAIIRDAALARLAGG
jgi:hypothetical protein